MPIKRRPLIIVCFAILMITENVVILEPSNTIAETAAPITNNASDTKYLTLIVVFLIE